MKRTKGSTKMEITELDIAKLGSVFVQTRTSDSLPLEILDRTGRTESATSYARDSFAKAIPANSKRGR
jgi:hypothetical protein